MAMITDGQRMKLLKRACELSYPDNRSRPMPCMVQRVITLNRNAYITVDMEYISIQLGSKTLAFVHFESHDDPTVMLRRLLKNIKLARTRAMRCLEEVDAQLRHGFRLGTISSRELLSVSDQAKPVRLARIRK